MLLDANRKRINEFYDSNILKRYKINSSPFAVSD